MDRYKGVRSLKKFFLSPQDIQTSIEEADRTLKEKQELLATQQDEIERIKAEMERLIGLHSKGEIPEKGFGRHYQPLEDRLEQVESSVPSLQGEIDFLKIQSYSIADAVTSAQDLYSHWGDLEENEKRQIVETITDNILIGNDEITINLSCKPASTKLVRNGQHNLRDSSRR